MAFYGSKILDRKDATAGSTLTFPIPQDEILAGVFLRFFGSIAIAGGTGAGTQLTDAILRAIRSVKLTADGVTLHSYSAWEIHNLLAFLLPIGFDQTSPASLAAGSSHAVEANVLMPFFTPHSRIPDATALAAPFLSKPMLEVEIGNAGDIARGEDGTLSFTSPVLEVTLWPLKGARDFADVYDTIKVGRYVVPLSQANTAHRIMLDSEIPGAELRGVMVLTEDNGSGGQGYSPSNAVVNYARLEINGTEVIGKSSFASLRQRNKSVYDLSSARTGVILLDAAESKETGRGDLWYIQPGASPVLELDDTPTGTGDTKVTILTVSHLRNPAV